MSLNRLSQASIILLLVLSSCTSRTVPSPAGVIPQPTRREISTGPPPTEDNPTLIATHAPTHSPTPIAPPPAGEPTTTPTPLPFGVPIPTPIPTQQSPTLIPTMPGTEVSWSDWEGPGIVFIKDFSEVLISNFDGSQKSVMAFMPGIGPWKPGFSPETGRIVAGSSNTLWVIDPGREPNAILELNPDQYIESPVITSDGTKIAYSIAYGFGDEENQQLWTINPDGTENILVIDNTGQFITDPGPFRLRPKAWSLDNKKVYLITTSDSDATPKGMYVADLVSGTIEKALTPPVTLWDLSFSPDRTQIAYRTFQWKPVPGFKPEEGPPFTLNVTDLTTGETRIFLESETDQYFHPIWSPDGKRLAYTVRPGVVEADTGLFTIDLVNGVTSKLIPGSENRRLIPWDWLPDEKILYTDGDLSSGNMFTYADGDLTSGNMWNSVATLYTVNSDGTEKNSIDTGGIIPLGDLVNLP